MRAMTLMGARSASSEDLTEAETYPSLTWTSRPVLVGHEDALSALSASSEAKRRPTETHLLLARDGDDDVPP
jgi:hypothetical protein